MICTLSGSTPLHQALEHLHKTVDDLVANEVKYTPEFEARVSGLAQEVLKLAPFLKDRAEIELERDVLVKLRKLSRRDPETFYVASRPLNYSGPGREIFAAEKMVLKTELSAWVESHSCNLNNYRLAAKRIEEVYAKDGKTLDLTGLDLEDLPECLNLGIDLEKIDLSHNRLRRLPDLSRCPYLRVLQINHNQFESLPESLGQCRRLQELYADHNRLSSLPKALFECPGVNKVSLRENNLKIISPLIGQWRYLAQLNLCNNPELESLPETLGELALLTSLNTAGTSISVDALKPLLTRLAQVQKDFELYINELGEWINKDRETRLDVANQFVEAYFGTELKLPPLKLRDLPPLGRLKRLQKLSVRTCALFKLPACLSECTQLRVLEVSGNMLKFLPDLSKCTQLEQLELGHNQFKTLPSYLHRFEKLTTLYIHTNSELRELPLSVSQLPKLKDILSYDTGIANSTVNLFRQTSIASFPKSEVTFRLQLWELYVPKTDAHWQFEDEFLPYLNLWMRYIERTFEGSPQELISHTYKIFARVAADPDFRTDFYTSIKESEGACSFLEKLP